MPKIVIKNLYKIFGKSPQKALSLLKSGKTKEDIYETTGMTVGVQNASFEIEKGEIFVVMGLSGSGKSTLVRMLNRLIEPTGGEVLVDGEDVLKMDNQQLVKFRRSKTSMVFQSFALMPHLSVLDNVAFGLELDGIDKETRKQRALDALKQVGLDGWENAMPDELSGGMQQRVGLARGLAVDPDILLMDEAFSALDPLIRTEMQDELLKLQDRQERTIVFISHDLDEALRIGDRIAIMEGGRVVQVGTPEEILQNPADDYVRAFSAALIPPVLYLPVISFGTPNQQSSGIHLREAPEQPWRCLTTGTGNMPMCSIQNTDSTELSPQIQSETFSKKRMAVKEKLRMPLSGRLWLYRRQNVFRTYYRRWRRTNGRFPLLTKRAFSRVLSPKIVF